MQHKIYFLLLVCLFCSLFNASGQITVQNGATITVENGQTMTVEDYLNNFGTIGGGGTYIVQGDLTQTGLLEISIGPTVNDHTTIDLPNGTYMITGSFTVTEVGGYTPSNGDQATIITAMALKNTFSNANDNTWIANYNIPAAGNFTVSFQPPVPVELIQFNVSKIGDAVELSWETASEFNNEGFEVLRSADAVNWENLSFIPGQGTSTQNHAYSFRDEAPLSGINYYRLRQIDFDDNFEYSDILSVVFDQQKGMMLLYPNPTRDRVQLEMDTDLKGKGTLQFFDYLGRPLLSLPLKIGINNRFNLDLSRLPKGIYTVILNVEGKRWSQRLIKK